MVKKSVKKKTSKKKEGKVQKNIFFYFTFAFLSIALITICSILGVNLSIKKDEVILTPSDTNIPAIIEGDQGELIELEDIPTYEEVDGGQFMDINEMEGKGEYTDLGWSETYNVKSPEAFKNDTLNKCIYANNYYGAQCVSLARVFWWSYANRDVSTCGTGMAKGMMNCADANAGKDFLIYWEDAKHQIQAGDWLIFNGGSYGHVCMSLGGYNNGYVACLGENQGGQYCDKGGAATNIININLKNLIGYYRPKSYVKPEPKPTPEPTPTPTPTPEVSTETYVVKKGDTLGGIVRKLKWYTGDKLFGDDGYCQLLAEFNGIENRSLIYPNQIIKRK